MTYNVFGGTLSLTQSIKFVDSESAFLPVACHSHLLSVLMVQAISGPYRLCWPRRTSETQYERCCLRVVCHWITSTQLQHCTYAVPVQDFHSLPVFHRITSFRRPSIHLSSIGSMGSVLTISHTRGCGGWLAIHSGC